MLFILKLYHKIIDRNTSALPRYEPKSRTLLTYEQYDPCIFLHIQDKMIRHRVSNFTYR